MRRDLATHVRDHGMSVFWTVLVGRELHMPDHRHPGDEYRWVTASASYLLNGDQVTKVHCMSARCRPGPEKEHDVDWAPRQGES